MVFIPDKDRQLIEQNLGSKEWRMNNLYYILPESGGEPVQFQMNQQQRYLFKHRHNRNLVLKARRIGITTYYAIYMLDDCLFLPHQRAGFIAHTKLDANKIYRDMVQFAYNHLPQWLRDRRSVKPSDGGKNEGGWMIFSNGSSYYVSNSFRGSGLTHLHVSEFGKICAKDAAKAGEIVSGAFQTVNQHQFLNIESTAEGPSGHFYNYCEMARTMAAQKRKLTGLDWKFFFFPWHEDPKYQMADWELVTIPAQLEDHFKRLAKDKGIVLSDPQKAWYTKKLQEFCAAVEITQGGWDTMRQEYPSYPEEAFHRSIEGAYYSTEFAAIDIDGRITKVSHNPYLPVDTWWDLGHSDSTAIWFTQTFGQRVHVIDYYENSLKGLPHYYTMLDTKRRELKYNYGRMVAPHDIEVHDLSHGMTRREHARQFGINFEVAARGGLEDGIENVRRILSCCWFDESRCSEGLSSLRTYQRGRDEKSGDWTDKPKKGKANHGADAFRTFATKHDFNYHSGRANVEAIEATPAEAWT